MMIGEKFRRDQMSKWIDATKVADLLDMDEEAFRRIVKSSKNSPPFVRPSERTMLFDVDALMKWRESWTVCGKQTG
jgi:hypothetical protein